MTQGERLELLTFFPVVYNELFSSKDEIASKFRIDISELEPYIIIYAFYEYEDYSGSAEVLYYNTNDEKFYEVHGGHCSCYGLEGQWEPEEIGSFINLIEYIKHKQQ